MFFFVETNSSSGNTQFEPINNLSASFASNDFGSNFSRQTNLNDFILKEAYKYPLREIHNYVSRLNSAHRFNGSILVAKDGKILFEEHIGYKDPRHKKSIENTDTYQLASVSKQFTAAAILLLYQEGKLDLDDFATKYLTNFPYKNITIRHLLNHVSGLPNYMWAAEHNWTGKLPPDNAAMLNLMNKLKMQAYFKPGSRFDYSNTGYFILASIVSKISDQSLSDFLDSKFFNPLNMQHTYVRNPNEETGKNELLGFRRYGRSYRSIPFSINDGVVGDKGIYSTVSDLFKWNQSLTESTILNDAVLAKAFLPGKTNNGKSVPYGFGFRLKQEDDSDMIYHNGVWNGFRNTLRRYEADNITIIILNNNSFNSITAISEELHELSKAFSKYDRFASFIENTNIYDIDNLKKELVNFNDIPKSESVEIIEQAAKLYYKQNERYLSLKYLEVSDKYIINQQYQSLLN
ncbi:serine hydrolase domain-containing protein [Lutibacter sp.]|uniref:serine hydrolase domain-containing protein n=1 Tax=Lutibacter sp. TaxID=1925666 RepID=UPI00356A68B6